MRIYYPDHKGNELLCEWKDCAFGLGLAGRGLCPGIWFMKNCPEYQSEDEFLNNWKKESENKKLHESARIKSIRKDGMINHSPEQDLPCQRCF